MIDHWIWLATRPHIRDQVKVSLLEYFRDPESVFFADSDSYMVDGLTPEGKASLEDKDLSGVQKILADCRRERLQILTYQDAAYPQRLQNISDPPLVLYYKGQLPDFDAEPVVGVVGTRNASAYGLGGAKRMGYQIAKCGGVVVSGMAFGIDSMAMSGALTSGMPVVGVLGCGADIVYPVSGRSLFADTEQFGCIMSEFPPGTPPMRQNFPRRNRIISGLSCGVLVVEAPEKSGALITAHQAADQGRDVFVVPGNIDVPSCVGSNRLLRDGAIAVSSGWDILSEYEVLFPHKIHKETGHTQLSCYGDEFDKVREESSLKVAQKPRIPGKKSKDVENCNKKVIDNEENSPYIDLHNRNPRLSETEGAIVAALQSGQRLVDDVITETGLPAGKLLATLTMLEVKGVVKRLPGRQVTLKK